MTEQKAIEWAVYFYVIHNYNDLFEREEECDREWISILQQRIRALIPFIKANNLFCESEANAILEM